MNMLGSNPPPEFAAIANCATAPSETSLKDPIKNVLSVGIACNDIAL